MTFQEVPNTCECRLFSRYTGEERFYENVFYMHKAGAWTDANVTTLAARVLSAVDHTLTNIVPDSAQYFKGAARDLTDEFGFADEDAYEVDGLVADQTWLPPNNAAFMRFIGTGGFAPREGGCFHPFVQEADVSDIGRLTGGAITAYADAWTDYLDAVAASVSGVSHVIVSRFNKHLYPTPPHLRPVGIVNERASINTRPVISSQRDRRPRA
jgi:hypothetical protein